MNLVRSIKHGTTHKVQEVQGDYALTGCGSLLPYRRHTRIEDIYPTCQRCARKV